MRVRISHGPSENNRFMWVCGKDMISVPKCKRLKPLFMPFSNHRNEISRCDDVNKSDPYRYRCQADPIKHLSLLTKALVGFGLA